MRVAGVALGLVAVSTGGGCSNVFPSKPDRPEYQVAIVEKLNAYYSKPENVKPESVTSEEERNRLISDLLYLVDVNYSEFERIVYERRADVSSLSDFLVLGLSGTGALMTPVNTIRILSGSSAMVTGTRTALEKNYLQEKSTQALLSSMQAARLEKLTTIRGGMLLNLREYPVGQALSDVEQYYEAGTLIGALNSIVSRAGEAVTKADGENQKLQQRLVQAKIGALQGNSPMPQSPGSENK